MQLINRTEWDTSDLKKLCNAVLNHEGARNDTLIKVDYRRRKWCNVHGMARLNGNFIWMYVPRTRVQKITDKIGSDGRYIKTWKDTTFPVLDFTQVLMHEIGHNQGLMHNEMLPVSKLKGEFTSEMTVNKKQPKPKKKIDVIDKRYKLALKNLKNNQTKSKRAETLVKKWKNKVKYYERKLEERE